MITREEMEAVLDRHVHLGDIIQYWDDMVDAATDLANGIRKCPACLGNDADMPCAYPGAGQRGCLRDKRLAGQPDSGREGALEEAAKICESLLEYPDCPGAGVDGNLREAAEKIRAAKVRSNLGLGGDL